ncbi:MAG: winged helix-turn-helix transcriptional regulator [Candidatus Aenigmarchaeota archaeon]|nr:winged helix-turn-helix transcriptional regulator [Candidatus Aenigmarchaeota archaeon]
MQKKRERLEIINDILDIIRSNNNSIKPTPLLRFSNMSTQRFNDYYNELIEKEFIREDHDKNGRKFITLTDKGFQFLQKYQSILGFVEEFDL